MRAREAINFPPGLGKWSLHPIQVDCPSQGENFMSAESVTDKLSSHRGQLMSTERFKEGGWIQDPNDFLRSDCLRDLPGRLEGLSKEGNEARPRISYR